MQVFALIRSLHNPRNIFCAVEGFPSYFLFWKIFLTTITSSFCLSSIIFDYTKTKRNSETASNFGLTKIQAWCMGVDSVSNSRVAWCCWKRFFHSSDTQTSWYLVLFYVVLEQDFRASSLSCLKPRSSKEVVCF